ncbi:Glyoxylate reductase/hydroxypyruvate reductase, putative [Pediculus humanus corporis]|uniref:Glyoxylate reductase/hydroxypyruvate reductase n=1 Tax=Pediculus humanus subsp. corporis TaxID=121224 RepID=E0VN74_PEDHC|nr:Glyoxylate reductase/hydroxypyruvate reductase, putative [Pediculus humanus corporis]EEB14830.1 Glyoxylate reductase/hydroxypyruvate reductase, putative [Pediculus humanus corporis]
MFLNTFRHCVYHSKPVFTRTMSVYSVYITRPDIPNIAIELLKKKGYNVTVWPHMTPIPREELLKEIVGKDALYCVITDKIDAEVLNKGDKLKVISTMSVGYEHLDINEIKKRNISIGYTPGVLTDAVAELTVGLLIATTRRFFESHQALLDGEWPTWSALWMCGVGLKNSTVGIVGFGRIGQAVAKRLIPFGVSQIVYSGRSKKPEEKEFNAKFMSLDELVTISDFVIVTCALTPETKGMFHKDIFKKMKPTSIFVNTSRGGVVQQDDLINALKTNTIGAAGLDVMTPEPLPTDHELLQLKNCVVIPHIGSATYESRHNMAQLTANNIIAALEKKPMPASL